MEKKNNKIILPIVLILLLMIVTVGVTYAFFNYTRTGSANTVRTGTINFISSQDGRINLTNIFPIDPEETGIMDDATKVGTVVITVTGDTTYDKGVEYLVSAVNVSNTVGTKIIPISISATTSGTLGTSDENYFDDRDTATSHIYKVLAKDTISNNDQLMVGYIAKGATGINGTITIKAYIDKNNIAISDTYSSNGIPTDANGTTSQWVNGRTLFTTEEWNNLQGTGVSFQVKVEANEGIWVEEQFTVNVMNTFPSNVYTYNIGQNVKEIYFNRMDDDEMEQRYNNAEIKADLTYNNEGKVLSWLEIDENDNTKYIMYIASDGKTYLTTGNYLFGNFNNVEKIVFNNVDTSMVTNMMYMYYALTKISSIDMSSFDMSNVVSTMSMFDGCTNLSNIVLDYNMPKIQQMNRMFARTNIQNIDLSNSGSDDLNLITNIFASCSNLKTVNMSNFNFGKITSLDSAFSYLTTVETFNLSNSKMNNVEKLSNMFSNSSSIIEIDLSNINIENVTSTYNMFNKCSSLNTIYVSNDWNVSNVTNSSEMFNGCTSLKGGGIPQTTYDENHTDKEYARIDGGANSSTPGYLTLKTN